MARTKTLLLERPRRQLLLALTLFIAGVGARLCIPGHTLLPYLFPVAAIAMVVTILLDGHLAIMVSAIMALIVGHNAAGSLELTVYAFISGVIAALSLWRLDHLGCLRSRTVALANAAVLLAFRLRTTAYEPTALVQLLGMALANAVLSASLAFVAFAAIGRLFGITTSLQLLELARPTHPLFRQLLIEASGSYHHSIVVSNMAERAARPSAPSSPASGPTITTSARSCAPTFSPRTRAMGRTRTITWTPRRAPRSSSGIRSMASPSPASTACPTGCATLFPSTTAPVW